MCTCLQLIKQKIFILEEHWTTNFLTAIRLQSLQGIIRFLSGMPVQNQTHYAINRHGSCSRRLSIIL